MKYLFYIFSSLFLITFVITIGDCVLNTRPRSELIDEFRTFETSSYYSIEATVKLTTKNIYRETIRRITIRSSKSGLYINGENQSEEATQLSSLFAQSFINYMNKIEITDRIIGKINFKNFCKDNDLSLAGFGSSCDVSIGFNKGKVSEIIITSEKKTYESLMEKYTKYQEYYIYIKNYE